MKATSIKKSWETVEGTLREKDSGQLMHSRIGPWKEANLIYVAQSELERRAYRSNDEDTLVIYDVGLGIAANSLAAMSAVHQLPRTRGRMEIYSFERYPEALAQAVQTPEQFPFMGPYLEAIQALVGSGSWETPCGRTRWKLLAGDFVDLDLSVLPLADLVYFDFYAPAVCPEHWGHSVFSKVSGKMKTNPSDPSLLITYASTKAVRSAMLLAGLFVGEGVATEMKHETTVASPFREALQSPITQEWLSRLERSKKPLPSDWPDSRREEALARIRQHSQFNR